MRNPAKTNRNKLVCEEYLKKRSIVKIGKEFNITRQRVWQIVKWSGVAHQRAKLTTTGQTWKLKIKKS